MYGSAVQVCSGLHDSQESTIFDILRKVLSSKVDRDDARPSDGGQIKSKSLNRKIEDTLSFILQVWRPPCMVVEKSEYEERKK